MIFFYSNHPDDLAGLDLLNADPTALLYQTGYLTISDYDADSNRVRLKVPNEEEVCDRPPPSLQDRRKLLLRDSPYRRLEDRVIINLDI